MQQFHFTIYRLIKMPSKRHSIAGPAPVAPIPQAKATVAPPAPQNINKSQKPQSMTRKNSMPQATRPSPATDKQSAVAQQKHEILSVLMDAGNDWKPRNKGTGRQYLDLIP
jgi:hypothetical protein